MEKEKKLVKNTLILSLGTVLPKLASFITLPIYTRFLTQTEYGIYDLIITLISLLIPIITLQIHSAVFRNIISEKNKEKKLSIISTGYAFIIGISILLLIIYIIFFNKVSLLVKIFIAIYFLLDILNQTTLQVARGLGKNKNYSINSLINSFLNVILVIPLLIKLKLGLNGLLLSIIIAQLVSILYLVKSANIYKYINLKMVNKVTLTELLKYSIPLVPNSISWWLLNSSDKIIVTAFLGIKANAIYAAASKIPHIYNITYTAFSMAWQESASQNNDNNLNMISKYYTNVFDNLFKILSGAVILLVAFTPILFKILLNNAYVDAYYQIPILYIAMFFFSVANFYSGIYIAMKKTKTVAATSFAAAMINLIIDIGLIKIIGLYAASISTLIAYLIITIYRGFDLNKYYNIKYNFKKIIIYIVLIFVSSILCYINNVYLNIINIIYSLICFSIMDSQYIKLLFNKGIKKYKNKINIIF